jgi:hypothetical protein
LQSTLWAHQHWCPPKAALKGHRVKQNERFFLRKNNLGRGFFVEFGGRVRFQSFNFDGIDQSSEW